MRKLFTVLAMVLMSMLYCATVLAAPMGMLVDEAKLIKDSDRAAVVATLHKIAQKHNMKIVFLTKGNIGKDDLGKLTNSFADQQGLKKEANGGVVFSVSVKPRKSYITTVGKARQAISEDYGFKVINNSAAQQLKKNNYKDAAIVFATQTDKFMTQFATGTPYTAKNGPKIPAPAVSKKKSSSSSDGIPLVGWAVILLVPLGIMYCARVSLVGSMSNVTEQVAAGDYLNKDSFNLSHSEDIFLYTSVVAVPKLKSSDDSDDSSSYDSTDDSSSYDSSSDDEHGGGGGSY